MSVLDDTDRRLLRVLQADGRITNAELAERCNLSPAATFDRVRRLRERGFITGYAALLDTAKVERALLIFVEVVLDRTTGDVSTSSAPPCAARLRSPECRMVAGGFDYLIKARVRDMEAYRTFLGDILVKMPGVRETRTYAVLEEVKSTVQLPL